MSINNCYNSIERSCSNMNNLPTNLRKLRKSKRLTQEQLAQKLGIIRATYWAYEKGTIQPPYDKVEFMADIFGVSVDELTGRNIGKFDVIQDVENVMRKVEIADDLTEKDRMLLLNSLSNVVNTLKIIGKM